MKIENNLIKERLKKLDNIKKSHDPYPHNIPNPKQSIKYIKNKYQNISKGEQIDEYVNVAGRIVLKRIMGKAAFLTIKDNFETIQIYLRDKDTKNFDLLENLDLGDFIYIEGKLFTTKVGELTVHANLLIITSKSLRPLPDKHKGLQDTELKYRHRHLDLIMNDETQKAMTKRVLMMKYVREFLDKKGFLEVETPILHPVYGGASAKPFTTYHNDLKMNLYLRISPELYLKRLIIGGYEKVYDINKNFRNEGIDTTHNPEFTMLEAYQSYADYKDMMLLFEELYEYVALKVNGTTKTIYKGQEIDLKAPWPRIKMLESIKEYAKIDVSKMSVNELLDFIKKHKIKHDKDKSWGLLTLTIFEHFCEDKYTNPVFIIDHPLETAWLCKKHRDDERLIERFEPFCCGMELGNAYTELNDPVFQKKLLLDQVRQQEQGDEEANPMDKDFLSALESAMPPTGGLGLGLDRMAMLITGKESIRDIIFFPTLKPEK